MTTATKFGFQVEPTENKFTIENAALLYKSGKTVSIYENIKTGKNRVAFSYNIKSGLIGNGAAGDAWTDEICVFECIKGQITIGSAQVLRIPPRPGGHVRRLTR